MNSEKLSQLLRNQDAIDALTIDELNALIEEYPYLQQLRDIKANKLEDFDKSGVIQNEAAFFNSGWNDDAKSEHEVIDLEEALSEISISNGDQVDEVKTSETEDLDLDKLVEETSSESTIVEMEGSDKPEEMTSVILEDDIVVNETLDIVDEEDLTSIAEEVEDVSVVDMESKSNGLDQDFSTDLTESIEMVHEEQVEEQVEEKLEGDIPEVEETIEDKSGQNEVDPIEEETSAPTDLEGNEIEDTVEESESLESIIQKNRAEEGYVITELSSELKDEEEMEESLPSMDDLTDNALVHIKKKKKKKKKKKLREKIEEMKKAKEKKKKKLEKQKKKSEKIKKEEDLVKKEKKSKEKKSKEKKDKKKSKKKKDKKKKARKSKSFLSPKSDYAKWLLEQKQISKKGKKRKKRKKTVDKAMQSLKKKKGIVSEPLAELLAAQGHLNQSKAMYKELSLIFPEKSTYFAAQIEKLENNK